MKAAEAKAEDTAKNSMTEIALAGKQAVARIKEEISSLIAAESTFSAVKAANLDPEFVKAMLLSVAATGTAHRRRRSNCKRCCPKPSGRSSTLRSPLRPRSCSKRASKWVIRRRYAPASRWRQGRRYYISFSDDDFEALLKEYLRGKISELLFKA